MSKELECLDRIDKRNYLTEREHKEFLGVVKQALIQAEQDKKKARCWDIIKERLDFEFEETIYGESYIVLMDSDITNYDECTWLRNLSKEEIKILKEEIC